jgi:DNA-directed RNA polymerase specialized sigma24 family protein
MRKLMPTVLADELLVDSFTDFVKEVEPRLRRALAVAFGIEPGAEASAEALAYAWENWERVEVMENPAGYLYQVGRSRARRRKLPRPTFPEVPRGDAPWVEPGLAGALARLTENQRTAVWLIHGFEWTLDETAQLLNISISSVRKHLARGERKLRGALGVPL